PHYPSPSRPPPQLGGGPLLDPDPPPYLFHRDPLRFVRKRPFFAIDARPRPSAQLLGTQRRHIDEQEPALRRRCRLCRNRRGAVRLGNVVQIAVIIHRRPYRLATWNDMRQVGGTCQWRPTPTCLTYYVRP